MILRSPLLQQLPESFLPEVNDFIDFVMHNHQNRIAEPKLPDDIAKAWAKSFEEVDRYLQKNCVYRI
ncbi:hypothetical protein QUA30_23160 [Microcoleus sp. Pol14C2]|uniref:hypothetical protein n=1 Tax=unclassified Microcoleus TaxID=2642155 RepID=UPI002FD35798